MVRAALTPGDAIEVRRSVIEGHAARVLEALSKTADLVVVGSHGHGEFVGMLLGSVSEHCVTHCHCPVLVYLTKAIGVPGGARVSTDSAPFSGVAAKAAVNTNDAQAGSCVSRELP
jgi:Universal stress protein family